VVLHLGDDDLVARADAELAAAPGGCVSQRPGHQVQRLGRVPGEDDLVAVAGTDERGHLVAGVLVGLARLSAQRVHRTGDVGVVLRVVVADRVDHLLRLLGRVRAVEVGQRAAAEPARQDREVAPDDVDVVAGQLEGRRARGAHQAIPTAPAPVKRS
jgi:hypothetical protein